MAFLRAGLEFTALNTEAHRLAQAAESGSTPDAKTAGDVMEHRWQLMRALLQQQPLAVNVDHRRRRDDPGKAAPSTGRAHRKPDAPESFCFRRETIG